MANIFKNYIAYIKDNPQKYWFRAKWYGWGWTPATKEGWAVTAVYIISLIILACYIRNVEFNNGNSLKFYIPFVALTLIFIFIAYKKGEKPHWSWGKPISKK